MACKPNMPEVNTRCPECGLEVVETGFTIAVEVTETWMRIGGDVQRIKTCEIPAPFAACLCCGAKLAATPAELVRAA